MNDRNYKIVGLVILIFVLCVGVYVGYDVLKKSEVAEVEQVHIEAHYISNELQKEFTMELLDEKINVFEKSICRNANCQVEEDTYTLNY
ncbi:MAG: hypothetical protein K2M17_04170, partial [Bacilli bacterium]|nr:hypothetical protein [Bacilli bacterium]